MLEENQKQKRKEIRPRKIEKRDIAESQFMTILRKVWNQSKSNGRVELDVV
jgi:hypothetical protein